MRIWCLGALTLACLVPGASGQTASEELAAIEQRYKDAEGSWPEKYKEFRPIYEAFAARHPGSEDALRAKLWQLSNCWWQRDAGTMETSARAIAAEILDEYPDSPLLTAMPACAYCLEAKDLAFFLGALRKSPHAEVRAAAILALAQRGKNVDRNALYGELIADYRDIRQGYTTYGELAEAALHPHDKADLAIGKPAPDIAGADVDGNPMRLSDYLGKVVVLDFWGDW